MECLIVIWNYVLSGIVKFFSVLIAAAVGAHIAFKYREHEDDKKRRLSRISSLKVAQGAVHSQWSALISVQKFIKEHNLTDNTKLNLNESIQEPAVLFVDIPSIGFLFDGKFANLVQEAMLAEGAYRTVKSGLKRRQEMIRYFHEERQKDGHVVDSAGQFNTRQDMVNVELFMQLNASLSVSVDEGCKQCEQVFKSLGIACKELFGVNGLELTDTPPAVP